MLPFGFEPHFACRVARFLIGVQGVFPCLHAGEHQVELLVGEVPVGLEVAEERGIKRLEETLGCESLVLLSGIPLGALQRRDSLL